MKKVLGILVLVMLLAVNLVSAIATVKFCIDSDAKDYYNRGNATDEKGINVDQCDGNSDNLKEYFCEEDKVKVENFKCEFGCSDGACNQRSVPEFTTIGAGLALLGAGAVYMFRKRK
jgi:hypothetical protein